MLNVAIIIEDIDSGLQRKRIHRICCQDCVCAFGRDLLISPATEDAGTKKGASKEECLAYQVTSAHLTVLWLSLVLRPLGGILAPLTRHLRQILTGLQ